MSIDSKIEKFNSSSASEQKKMLQGLSDHALSLEADGKEQEALKIHECIANSNIQLDDSSDDLNSLDESKLMGELMNLDPNQDLEGTALGGMLEGFMDDSSDLVNMSREYCEEAGINCPPSYSKQHTIDFENRPETEKLPPDILALVKGIGVDDHTITYLFPKPHPDNNWEIVLNTAFNDSNSSDIYMKLFNYVKNNNLCDEDDLDFLPTSEAEFTERKNSENRIQNEIAQLLEQNNDRAEAKLQWLINQAKSINATKVMITDHPDYGLEMGICEHNGKGSIDGSLDLLDNYDDWCEDKYQDDEDDYMLYGSQTWPWVRERWIKIGGPESGVSVVIFANGVGDTYDLNTGTEATEETVEELY